MMKKLVFLLIGFMVIAVPDNMKGQDNLQEVYVRENVPLKKPVPYEYIREADVMWSKIIYRMIDLRQKQNLALYYPTKPIGGRMNFVDLVLYGIDNEGVRAFSTNDPLNEFTAQMTIDQVDEAFDAGTDTTRTTDPTTGQLIDVVVENERRTDQVKKLLVKEKWFFDKNHSVMKVRIIGISPIRVYNRLDDQGMPTEEILQEQTFWVYFPEIRPILSNHEIFNRHNDSQRISYDDYFMQRRFDSHIFAVSNVYDNRWNNSYTMGVDALLEAKKQKEWLFNIEHDLWEY
ncbi:MAG: gliding motility protein GldN [Bacteroidales bacterium]|nr:gliding motility protein GldN [Bacteroidales bacterium]